MAMLWFDGGDYYTSSSIFPYEANNGVTISGTYARTGRNGFGIFGQDWFRKNLGENAATLVMGSAVSVLSEPTSGIVEMMGFVDAGIEQVGLYYNNAGQLLLGHNGAIVTGVSPTSAPFTYVNQFHYYELQVTFASSGGSYKVFVDGGQVLSGTGIQTAYSGNNYANQAAFGRFAGSNEGSQAMDDLYVLDTTGSSPWNAPLGDCAVVCEMPSASGSFAQWTPNPNTNANWQNVDSIPPGANFNQTAVTGARDSFNYPSFPPAGLTNIGQILAVMELEYGETTAAGSASVPLIPRQGGVDNVTAAPVALGLGYTYGYSIFELDVNGNLWIPSNLNATEFGYKRTS
jgi:hypothetical protein